MRSTIFYSWQSDTKSAANRSFIERALADAIAELRTDDSVAVDPAIERDTLGVPGAPDIRVAILEKIDACAAMVADVTIVGSDSERQSPNPNVLLELGYAF